MKYVGAGSAARLAGILYPNETRRNSCGSVHDVPAAGFMAGFFLIVEEPALFSDRQSGANPGSR
jgi:hypothetical protein